MYYDSKIHGLKVQHFCRIHFEKIWPGDSPSSVPPNWDGECLLESYWIRRYDEKQNLGGFARKFAFGYADVVALRLGPKSVMVVGNVTERLLTRRNS